jgi:hypothetical protein
MAAESAPSTIFRGETATKFFGCAADENFLGKNVGGGNAARRRRVLKKENGEQNDGDFFRAEERSIADRRFRTAQRRQVVDA